MNEKLAGLEADVDAVLREAMRINDLYVAESGRATEAEMKLAIQGTELERVLFINESQEAFIAQLSLENQRLNDLYVQAAGRADRAENIARFGSVPWVGLPIERAYHKERKTNEALRNAIEPAWQEAKRINDLYVDANRRATLSSARVDQLEKENKELLENTGRALDAVFQRGAQGPMLKGNWFNDDPILQMKQMVSDFFGAHTSSNRAFPFDVAVLLMLPGWENELRGNRWHVAKFLSQHMPVILVQPCLLDAVGGPIVEQERRLPQTFILKTRIHLSRSSEDWLEASGYAHDIQWLLDHMGAKEPLFWLFSPLLGRTFAMLEGGTKVFHATEDWPTFPDISKYLVRSMEDGLLAADHVIAVSEGVSASIAPLSGNIHPRVLTNGCDYLSYSESRPDQRILALRSSNEQKLAVFAGNIDYRIDYGLLARLVQEIVDIAVIVIGPVHSQSSQDCSAWRTLLRHPRVFYLGPFDPDLLPNVYASCDLGLIPYKELDFLVRSNFSLKALEMAATGLPVVSSKMDSIRGLASAIFVADSTDEFVSCARTVSKTLLSPLHVRELAAVARRHDYNERLTQALVDISSQRKEAPLPKSPLVFRSAFGFGEIRGRLELLRCLRAARSILGPKHVSSRELLKELARLHEVTHAHRSKWMFAACETWDHCADDVFEDFPVAALTFRAGLTFKLKAFDEALALYEMAEERSLLNPEAGQRTAVIKICMAETLLVLNRETEALNLFKSVMSPDSTSLLSLSETKRLSALATSLGQDIATEPTTASDTKDRQIG
jgi:glycosyltransferase involved in cell wall biosynthesis